MKKEINEMGLIHHRRDLRYRKEFDLLKKFFEELYQMPGIKIYMVRYSLNNTVRLFFPFLIFEDKIDVNKPIEDPLRSESRSGVKFKNDESSYIVNYTYNNCTLDKMYDYLFGSNPKYMHIKCADDISENDIVLIGFIGLDSYEVNEMCKVGFSRDYYEFSGIDYKACAVTISLEDLCNNINEIYDLFYLDENKQD